MTKKEKKRIAKLAKKKGELYKEPKKPKVKMKVLHEVTIGNFEFHIVELICLINFIPTNQYVYSLKGTGTIADKIKFNKKFKSQSGIDWENPSYQDGPVFRAKFLTKLLFWILENDEVIIENVVTMQNPEKPNWVRRGVLKTLMVKLDLFIVNFLARDCEYSENLYNIVELVGLQRCSQSQIKINNRFVEQKQLINDYFEGIGDIQENILWHTILRLAYIMVDGKQNFGDIPKFKEDLNINDPDEVKEIIGRLGIALIVNENKKRTSPLYKMWESSNAIISTQFDDIYEYPELVSGVKAIHYLVFLIDNPKFTDYIKRTI